METTSNTTKPPSYTRNIQFHLRLTQDELNGWHDLAKQGGFTTTASMVRAAVESMKYHENI